MLDDFSESYDLVLKDTKAQLSSALMRLLGAKNQDRVSIEYAKYDGKMTPVIRLADNGNLLSNNSFIFRGQEKEFLQQYGDKFKVVDDLGTLYLLGDKDFIVFTSVKQAVKDYIDMSIIEDTNYTIEKFTKYEL